MLEDGFLKSFNLYPDKTALITDEGEYTYRSLGGYVNAVLRILGEAGTQDGDKIGIDTKKTCMAGSCGTGCPYFRSDLCANRCAAA